MATNHRLLNLVKHFINPKKSKLETVAGSWQVRPWTNKKHPLITAMLYMCTTWRQYTWAKIAVEGMWPRGISPLKYMCFFLSSLNLKKLKSYKNVPPSWKKTTTSKAKAHRPTDSRLTNSYSHRIQKGRYGWRHRYREIKIYSRMKISYFCH